MVNQWNSIPFLIRIAALLLLLLQPAAAQRISYILPDIGSPGLTTYVEGIGPADAFGNFGQDGLHLNNAGDLMRVACVRPADTHKVKIGPVIVGWGGRMFSMQIFVMPYLMPSSPDWRDAGDEYTIPLCFIRNGIPGDTVLFRIVQPTRVPVLRGDVTLGDGVYGLRSPRGAMIVERLSMENARVRVSTTDCDPETDGNQGFLPFSLLSLGDVVGTGASILDVSAQGSDGGPGGGGGGGSFCYSIQNGWKGGNGFSSGGPGGRNPGGATS
ncbi:MAG: hypothetical protein KFF77_01455, partial [Bacteroidetes bacterium]|nr:hypothetical protein [Bacteroidota bacterium]